jgi:hypothetical protein
VAGGNKLKAISVPGKPLGNCRFLLAALVALLISFPFLEEVAGPLVLVIPIAVIFVAGVAVVDSGQHRLTIRAALIAAVQIGLAILSLVLHRWRIPYLIAVTIGVFATLILMAFTIYCVLGYVLRARVITHDQIYAGICMYLMLGFAFAAIFYLINLLDPGSFYVANNPTGRETPDLLYFSFVTLATLGYGDIAPASNVARSLAVVEALAGMLYIAIFMARLVSLHSPGDERQ